MDADPVLQGLDLFVQPGAILNPLHNDGEKPEQAERGTDEPDPLAPIVGGGHPASVGVTVST